MSICQTKTASLETLCFGICQIRIPVTIKSDKNPSPQGYLTMGKNPNGCFSACLWRFKSKNKYEKIATFFIENCDACNMQAIIEMLLSKHEP